MKINEEKANGIIITGDNLVYAKAVRKPNANTKIIKEMWFKGTAGQLKKLTEEQWKIK